MGMFDDKTKIIWHQRVLKKVKRYIGVVFSILIIYTLNSSESTWPPPFSTGVYRIEEPSPEGQRDKEIPLSQFISSLFEGVGQLLPGDFAGLLMCRPKLLAAGDSCCQKVLQRFSGSIQGNFPTVKVILLTGNLKKHLKVLDKSNYFVTKNLNQENIGLKLWFCFNLYVILISL